MWASPPQAPSSTARQVTQTPAPASVRPPVDQGLRPLLAGQGDVQGIQNFLVRRVQRHGGPPEQQAGIRDVFRRARIVALVFTFRNRARPEATPQQKTHGPLTSVA